jgi:NAD(P)-dependent dehydrogenase (short-subunit alcohol dehydrogenase family)
VGLEGRTVLVTGATGGIGGVTALRLAAAGADVVASGDSQPALDDLASKTGWRTLLFDLTSEDSIRQALEGLDLWGVVNCGGFGGEIATPMDTDISVFDKVISVNARGALLVIKYASRTMIRLGRGGSIVNVSSQAARRGLDDYWHLAADRRRRHLVLTGPLLAHTTPSADDRFPALPARLYRRSGRAAKGRHDAFARPSASGRSLRNPAARGFSVAHVALRPSGSHVS